MRLEKESVSSVWRSGGIVGSVAKVTGKQCGICRRNELCREMEKGLLASI